MADYRCTELKAVGDKLFSDKTSLNSLHQELAELFYVERATFTAERSLGESFADNLTSSYTLQARRSLGDLLGSMLRPRDRTWAKVRAKSLTSPSHEAMAWLEWATQVQKNAMYDQDSGFVRATKEGDHDYATFGQCVISSEFDWKGMNMLYRNHHIRDVCWSEGMNGKIERIDRCWKPTVSDLYRRFGDKCHEKIKMDYEKGGEAASRQIECRHIVLPSDMYESSYKDSKTGKSKRFPQPWVSIYIDLENEFVFEEVGSWTRIYTIPRWLTVSDSQYAYSPAAIIALPDARLYQAMALTLLESGENYTRPPLLAVGEAIRGDINYYSGGVTYISDEYDERMGDVLRPLNQDKGGFSIGLEMWDRVKADIHDAFFLNKINLPPHTSAEMTALETQQRVTEYIRDAMPIFEPIEYDYNADICKNTFTTLLKAGGFGKPDSIPEELQGKDIDFEFESPIHAAEERLKGQKLMGAIGLVSQAAGIDPSSADIIDIQTALRDSIIGSEVPLDWMRSEEQVQEIREAQQKQQQEQQMMQSIAQGAEVAKATGEAGQALAMLGAPTE